MSINFVSFDFWGTLADPNPYYGAGRNAVLEEIYGSTAIENYTPFHNLGLGQIYSVTKRYLDAMAEVSSVALSTPECYKLLSRTFETKDALERAQKMQEGFTKAFFEHPPIMPDDVKALLEELNSRNIRIAIASNTNFVSGVQIRQFLESKVGDIIGEYAFSDEMRIAKPQLLSELYTGYPYNVLHVGDHEVCDGKGAEDAGIRFLLTDSAFTTASRVKDFLTQEN